MSLINSLNVFGKKKLIWLIFFLMDNKLFKKVLIDWIEI